MAPTDDLDRGLVLARHADVIAAQAVGPILKLAREFEIWLQPQRGIRGPQLDVDQAVRLIVAIETVAAIRRRRKLRKRAATPTETTQVARLLFAEAAGCDAIKRRMHRLQPRIDAFREQAKAARSARWRC